MMITGSSAPSAMDVRVCNEPGGRSSRLARVLSSAMSVPEAKTYSELPSEEASTMLPVRGSVLPEPLHMNPGICAPSVCTSENESSLTVAESVSTSC